ncbi:hypothetical protein SD71_14875 [Cohnella kolymensis]|uniref:Uncharacterized protein n=1 Tax=Cohnella kolymensis TaxID=1590652 RepID=A0ABR5A2N2_9BACL|nr:hypothetical protein [Cohnella kolymensis]KIL35311.1 hypothetical protein SD71_14875 [Cohnella kolymensis]
MSYKSIDLQVSIPRSAELTPLQHQQQQRPATEQSLLGEQTVKDAERQAKRSPKTAESTGNGGITERQPRNRNGQSSQHKKQRHERASEDTASAVHPYKGKHIDFMG